jgi:hypothetical protein
MSRESRVRLFLFIGVALVSAILTEPAKSQTVIADCVSEFSGVQGNNNWYYGYYQGTFNSPGFRLMEVYDPDLMNWFVENGRYWTRLWTTGAHPNAETSSFDREEVEQWAVRRWVSEVDGKVTISVTLAKWQMEAGDGVTGHIFIDGVSVWDEHIAYNDTEGVQHAISVEVTTGSTVDFVLEPGETDWEDGSHFYATIVVPEVTGSDFDPGIHGFTFPNWPLLQMPPQPLIPDAIEDSDWGAHCLGVSYAALHYYYCDAPIPYTGETPPDPLRLDPGERETLRIIETYQKFFLPGYLEELALLFTSSWDTHELLRNQLDAAKRRISTRGSTVLLLLGRRLPEREGSHVVVAYRIEEDVHETRIYIYNPNYKRSYYQGGEEIIHLPEDGLGMLRLAYKPDQFGERYTAFTCLSPFMELPPDLINTLDDFFTTPEASDAISSSEQNLHFFDLDAEAKNLIAYLYRQRSDLDLVVESPSSVRFDPSSAATNPNVQYREEDYYEYYVISDPEPGKWILEVTGVEVPIEVEDYSVGMKAQFGSGDGDYQLDHK